jgi:hypothetical protein
MTFDIIPKVILFLVMTLLVVTRVQAEDPAIHGNHGHGWYEQAGIAWLSCRHAP